MKIDPSFIMYDNECQLKFNIDMISIAFRWLRISRTGKLCFCVCKLELKLKLFIKKPAKLRFILVALILKRRQFQISMNQIKVEILLGLTYFKVFIYKLDTSFPASTFFPSIIYFKNFDLIFEVFSECFLMTLIEKGKK